MFLAGVLTEAEELQVPAADAPAGSQNEYQGQGQPAVPAHSEHSELILCFSSDHVSLSESPWDPFRFSLTGLFELLLQWLAAQNDVSASDTVSHC